jgi:hypothetical protein
MKINKLAFAIALTGTLTANSHTVLANTGVQLSPEFQKPAEPSTPERGSIPSTNKLEAKLDPTAPCEATWKDYGEAYMKWIEKPPSVLNECGLGRLINFQLLQGFDPFGSMISAIKGSVCGFIKNEISDPFVNKLNAEISDVNRWVGDKNDQYSSWIDETARDLQYSIYDPRTNFTKSTFPDGANTPTDNTPVNNPVIQPSSPNIPSPVMQNPGDKTDKEILDDGGSISVGENVDGNEIIISGSEENAIPFENSSEWENIFNLYE